MTGITQHQPVTPDPQAEVNPDYRTCPACRAVYNFDFPECPRCADMRQEVARRLRALDESTERLAEAARKRAQDTPSRPYVTRRHDFLRGRSSFAPEDMTIGEILCLVMVVCGVGAVLLSAVNMQNRRLDSQVEAVEALMEAEK